MGEDLDAQKDSSANIGRHAGKHADEQADRYFEQQFDQQIGTEMPVVPISDTGTGTVKRKRAESDRDPSEGGWDATIVAAPISHTNRAHKKHRHRHHHHSRTPKWVKPLVIVLIVVAVLAGAAFGLFTWYMSSLDSALAFDGETKAEVEGALTEASADQPFYTLATTSGLRADADGNGAGAIVLLRVDPTISAFSALLIPRDTPYTDSSGSTAKIASVYEDNGAAGIIGAVEELTGLKISHYAEVDEGALESLINNLGGISIDVPAALDFKTAEGETVHLDEGLRHLNGEQALVVAGTRSLYEGAEHSGDRQPALGQVLSGIAQVVTTRPLLKKPGAISDTAACVKTDLTAGELLDLITRMGKTPTAYSGIGPASGAVDPYVTDSASSNSHPWLCYVNETGWQNALAALQAGEDPSLVSYAKDAVHFAGQPEDTWSLGPVTPDDLRALEEALAEEADADEGYESEEEIY